MVTGVFGGQVKVFDFLSGKELASFENLEWIGAPCDIDNRYLVAFLNNHDFIYVNNERELIWVESDSFGNWNIKTKITRKELLSFRILFDIEYDSSQNSIKCYGESKDATCIIEL